MIIFEKQLDNMYFDSKDDLDVTVEKDGKLNFTYHEPKHHYNKDGVTTIFKLSQDDAIKLAFSILHHYVEL